MPPSSTTVVLFAYHNVGVRCLQVLLAHGVRVALLVTHQDDPTENHWFDSIAALAKLEQIPTITPENPNSAEIIKQVTECHPDFIFSFYYRKMLAQELLEIPKYGAYNLHGSLLPKYRGRVPINWAVLHGEKQTGVTLHEMVIKPDAGAIVDQETVSILPNDTAHHVFQKAVCAGEQLLTRIMPQLLSNTLTSTAMDLSQGNYFGGRKPEDGRIRWHQSAWEIHNLIRAVAPPYPGAFFEVDSHHIQVLGSHYRGELVRSTQKISPRIYWENADCYVDCMDGKRLQLLTLMNDQQTIHQPDFQSLFGQDEITV